MNHNYLDHGLQILFSSFLSPLKTHGFLTGWHIYTYINIYIENILIIKYFCANNPSAVKGDMKENFSPVLITLNNVKLTNAGEFIFVVEEFVVAFGC